MRKLAIYGAGQKALTVEKTVLQNLQDVEIQYVIENKQFSKVGKTLQSFYNPDKKLSIISLNTCQDLIEKEEINGIVFPTSYHLFDWNEIFDIAKELGIKEECIFAVPIDILLNEQLAEKEKERILTPYKALNQIYHMDIHVTDNCNLKCRGCAHFSPLVKENTDIPVEAMKKNIAQLKSLVPNICEIAVLGGEPLMCPDLKQHLEIISQAYPYARIHLVTNGILVTQMAEDLVALIKEKNVQIQVSMYPALKRNLEKWITYFEEKGLNYVITECASFERRLWKTPVFNGAVMTKKCGHDLCMTDHYVARCPMIAFVKYFNCHFEKQLPDDGKIDIFEIKSGLELISKLNDASGLCDYCCARDHCYEKWENYVDINEADENDWFMNIQKELLGEK